MKRTTTFAIAGVAVVALVLGGLFGAPLFLPEESTTVNEMDANDGNATVLKSGEFVGKDGHAVSGTVELRQDAEGYYLYFENYSQTQGPDVFLYLTPAEDPDTSSEIAEGIKVKIDGGADGGEMTKEGTFTQRLPDDFDPSEYRGVAVWCDRFSVPFGAATFDGAA